MGGGGDVSTSNDILSPAKELVRVSNQSSGELICGNNGAVGSVAPGNEEGAMGSSRRQSVLAAVLTAAFAASGIATATSVGAGSPASAPPASDVGSGAVSAVPVADDFDPEAIFRWGYSISPTSLDPHRGSSSADQNFLFPVYDRLIYASPEGEYEPQLATEWSLNEDLTVLTFELREGVTFHDGTPLDAEAVKTNLDRARGEESTVKAELASVVDVRVTGPLTVEVEVSGGAGALLGSFADRAGMIISPTALTDGTDLNITAVGAGPYQITENRVGDRVIYERYADYWDPEVQRVAGMEIQVIADEQARLNALETGDLSMAVIGVDEVDAMEDRGLNVLAGLGPQFIGFTMNAATEPFDDPLVRQAIYQSIDRVGIADQLMEGLCEPQVQYWPSNSWAYDSELGDGLDVWPYDPEAAQALLAEAGVGDGFEFSIPIADLAMYVALAEVIQANLAEVGITMNIELVDGPQLFQQYRIDKTAPATLEVFVGSPDPSGVMNRVLLPTAIGNPGAFSNDRIVELAGQAASAVDTEERAALYHEINGELIDLVPHVGVICVQYRTEAFADGVSGIAVYPSGARDFRGVAISSTDS